MKKIYYASIEGPDHSRHTGEIMEAEHGEEWDGDVAAYLDNIDAEYIEGPQHIPGDVQQHFTATPANICVELSEGTPVRIWWTDEEDEEGTPHADQSQVVTKYGIKVNFDAAVNLMDDDLREAIHATGEYDDDPQGFFEAYAAAHLAQFGQLWELDKPHPIY